jgi:hypothetical protein
MGKAFSNAWLKFAYDPDGNFSMTRIFMALTFILALSTGIVGIVAFLGWDKVLPTNLYTYVGGLSGGGIVQYGFTKLMGSKAEGEK